MTVKQLLAASLLLSLPLVTTADTLGFRIEAGMWNQSFEGDIQSGTDSVDIQDTLGLDDETNNFYSITLEHPIPILPNLRLSRTELDVEETSQINQTFTFDGVTYLVSDTVKTDADLSHTDATLYYEVLDNVVSLDIGLNIRSFDEGVLITSTTGNSELDVDGVLPMLFVGVKFDLPLSGLYLSADANGINYKKSSIIDYKVSVGYETGIGLGLEAGLRTFDVDYEDEDNSDEKADLTIDGAYASLFYHF